MGRTRPWNPNEFSLPKPNGYGIQEPYSPTSDAEKPCRLSVLATQRDRTAKMGLDELKEHMHLTLTEAANKLKVCPAVIKKVCRRNGIKRWPCRKIRAIERNIANVEQNMANPVRAVGRKAELQRKLDRLRVEKELAYKPPPKGDCDGDDWDLDLEDDDNDNAPAGPAW